MGNCTGVFAGNIQIPNPKDPSVNRCSDGLGDIIGSDVTRLCIPTSDLFGVGLGDEDVVADYCATIGTGEEWDASYPDDPCCGSDGDTYRDILLGDVDACVGTCKKDIATTLRAVGNCKRTKFVADPVVCCFLDNDCTNNNIKEPCFQTPLREKTCDPNYRNLSSDSCLEKIEPYCTGEQLFLGQENWWDLWVENTSVNVNSNEVSRKDPKKSKFTPSDWKQPTDEQLERKMTQPCMRALARAISKDNEFCTWDSVKNMEFRRGNFDPDGLAWAERVVGKIFDRYTREFGSFIGEIDRDGIVIDSMVDVFSEICTKYPILCQNSLKSICKNITAKDIASGNAFPGADKWCGCYMPDKEYEKYTNLFQINRQCTPFCNTDSAIPLVDPDGYQIYCMTDVCIVDDLKLEFLRNSGDDKDSVNFSLMCGGCGGLNVKTAIDGGTVTTQSDTIMGIYSQIDFLELICPVEESSGYNYENLFADGKKQTTVTMTGENNNQISVTLELDQSPVGNDNLSVYGIKFVSATPINTAYTFKNNERLTLDGNSVLDDISCNTYAIATTTGPNGKSNNSTRSMFRHHEVYGNQCTCILEGSTISIIDSEFRNLNLNQNCGTPQCTSKDGKPIPCMNSSDENDINYYTREEAYNWNKNNIKQDKFNAIGLILLGILIFFIILSIGLSMASTFRSQPKKK